MAIVPSLIPLITSSWFQGLRICTRLPTSVEDDQGSASRAIHLYDGSGSPIWV